MDFETRCVDLETGGEITNRLATHSMDHVSATAKNNCWRIREEDPAVIRNSSAGGGVTSVKCGYPWTKLASFRGIWERKY